MSDARWWIFDEINQERVRQDEKHWGTRDKGDLPDVEPESERTVRGYGLLQNVAMTHGVPMANIAKRDCDQAFRRNSGSWAHILVEEIAEAIEAAALKNVQELRKELIQCAAVCVAWVEAIDRRPK